MLFSLFLNYLLLPFLFSAVIAQIFSAAAELKYHQKYQLKKKKQKLKRIQ